MACSANADAWLAHCAARCRALGACGLPVAVALGRREPARRRERRGLGAPRALSRAGGDGARAGVRPRAAGPPSARPGRDLAAAGAARRRRRRAWRRMPRQAVRDGITWARPWLDVPREAIEAYVRRHRLRHVDDDSNADARFARNRLRRRSGRRCARPSPTPRRRSPPQPPARRGAALCSTSSAHADLRRRSATGRSRGLVPWRASSEARRNALRAWLRARLGRSAASEPLVERLMLRSARWPATGANCACAAGMRAARATVRRVPDARPRRREQPARVGCAGAARRGARREAASRSPGCATRAARAQRRRALPAAPRTPPRSLKKQFQAAGVPAWQRDGAVALCCGRPLAVRARPGHRRACAGGAWRSAGARWRGVRSGLQLAPGGPQARRYNARFSPARIPALAMALIVHKYGGTSMGSTERIRNVAKRVAKWARAGHQMVVVPSAMSGETNRLLGLAKELRPSARPPRCMRELDMIAATGEQVSVGLLAHRAAGRRPGGGELRRLAGADRHRHGLHQGAHREHRRRARARRPGRRQGRHHHRLPGRRRRRPHHHARAAAAPTPRRWRWPRR